MLRLFLFEVFKLFRLRSVGLGLLSAFLLPFLWALAPGLKEVYGLVLASGWQVVSLSLMAGMEFLFPFLVVMAASESLGSEVAQGTLKSLLLRPLPRTSLLLAKLLSALLYPFVLLSASFLGGLLAGLPHGLGAFYGGTGLGEGGFAGVGLLTPKEALLELLRAHLLAGAVLLPLASLALLYGTLFLSTTASALAAVATLLLMRLLVAFPALTPFLLTTYLDLYLRPEAAGLGLSLLLIYTLGFAFLGAWSSGERTSKCPHFGHGTPKPGLWGGFLGAPTVAKARWVLRGSVPPREGAPRPEEASLPSGRGPGPSGGRSGSFPPFPGSSGPGPGEPCPHLLV